MRPFAFAIISIVLALTFAAPAAAQDATPAAEEATPETMAPVTEQVSTSDVYWFPDTFWSEVAIPDAFSSLVTFEEGASMSLTTTGLEPGHAVTIWWVVFNNPEHCTNGEAPMRCGEGDLLIAGGDEAVEGTVLAATGHIIGPDGAGHFDAYLATGDTTGVVGVGPGLTNPLGAEIHLVVRTHGPPQPGLVGDQVQTFGGGCNNAPEGTGGEPGDFACTDLQFAFHIQ